MFTPPRCPNSDCPQHSRPGPSFFVRHGFYRAKCRPHPIPRFRCRTCRRGFSRQTFRMDYRDHKPHLNPEVFLALASGLGIRQTSRTVGLSLRCTELKWRKIARHLRDLNLNLRGPLPPEARFQFDELETYEGRRNTRPLTVPILIEKESRFVVWSRSAPIRPRGRMSEARKRAIAEDEKRLGPRPDRSRSAIRLVLRKGAALSRELPRVFLDTDGKAPYSPIARRIFGSKRLVHRRTNSRLPRTTWNPLFPINHEDAMLRYLAGRLRRDSWLASKRGWCLDLHLQIFMAYRNYVRYRFNGEEESPAQRLGFVERRMTPRELLSWRQDWRENSIHPLAAEAQSIASWRERRRAA